MSVNVRRAINTANLPTAIELGTQQAVGISVDNYSGFWLRIAADYFVPPFTLGWASNLMGSYAGGITIIKNNPPGISLSPGVANATAIITLFDTFIQPSAGLSIDNPPTGWDYNSEGPVAAGTTIWASSNFPKGNRIRRMQLTAVMVGGTAGLIEVLLHDGVTNSVWATVVTSSIIVVTMDSLLINPQGEIPIIPTWTFKIRRTDITGVGSYLYSYQFAWGT